MSLFDFFPSRKSLFTIFEIVFNINPAIILIFLIVSGFMAGCVDKRVHDQILLDFESDKELDQLFWKCHVRYTLLPKHVTHGEKALCLELYPDDYPGMMFRPTIKDWRRYQAFKVDIYNPYTNDTYLVLRIDDKKKPAEFQNRFNRKLILKPGMNHLVFPFRSLITSGTERQLNLSTIERVFFFIMHPREKCTFYMDYLRLTQIE